MFHANILVATTLVAAAASAALTPPREGKYCSDTQLFSVAPDPTDCSRYFRCLDNKYYAMECGDGLLFDEEESYCDYSENVKCESSMYGITMAGSKVASRSNVISTHGHWMHRSQLTTSPIFQAARHYLLKDHSCKPLF